MILGARLFAVMAVHFTAISRIWAAAAGSAKASLRAAHANPPKSELLSGAWSTQNDRNSAVRRAAGESVAASDRCRWANDCYDSQLAQLVPRDGLGKRSTESNDKATLASCHKLRSEN